MRARPAFPPFFTVKMCVLFSLQNKTVAPKSASEMKMAAAVAEATHAAAAAASAAASAASRCSVIVRKPEKDV